MSNLTDNLKLFKWNTADEEDLDADFDIDKAMNKNWDKLDENAKSLGDKINSNQEEIIQNISKQNELIQKLIDNSIRETTEEATSLQVKNASTVPAKFEIKGNCKQEITEVGNNIFNGRLEAGDYDYDTGEKVDLSNTVRSVDFIDIEGLEELSIVKESGGVFSVGLRFYSEDKEYIGRASLYDITDGATFDTNHNEFNSEKTVKYLAFRVTNGDLTAKYAINKDQSLIYEEYIPNSPSPDYPSKVIVIGDSENLFDGIIELGAFDGEGKKNTDTTQFRNANIIDLKGADTIKFSCNGESIQIYVYEYNASKQKVKEELVATNTSLAVEETTKYINFSKTNNNNIDGRKIKVEAVPYKAGAVKVKNTSSNVMTILELGSYWKYTDKGITNIEGNSGHTITSFYLKKGQTIKINFKLFTKPTKSTTFTATINLKEYNNYSFLNFQEYNLNQIYTKTYTAKEDCVLRYTLWGNSSTDIFEFQLWANINEAEEYRQYQEKTYNLPIQQPMLKGDYFIKETDGWKEVHHLSHINSKDVLDISVALNGSNKNFRRYSVDLNVTDRKPGEYILNTVCTHFKYADCRWNEYEGICGWENGQNFCISTFNTELDTVEKMEAFLKNNDVKIYYDLATPQKLSCTEEQKQVLDKLEELELFKGTNNIITTENLALMQMTYTVDTKAYIDSKIANTNAQILNS